MPPLPLRAFEDERFWRKLLEEALEGGISLTEVLEAKGGVHLALRKGVRLDELASLIEARRVDDAVNALNWAAFNSELAGLQRPMVGLLLNGARLGAVDILEPFQALLLDSLSRPPLRASAAQWASSHSADLISGIDRTTRSGLRDLITRGVRRGQPPKQIARALRGRVGLDKFRGARLDKYIQELIADPENSAARIQYLTERRYNELLKERYRTIAENEAHQALVEGQRQIWEANAETLSTEYFKELVVITDGKCSSNTCPPMDGQVVPVGQRHYVHPAQGPLLGPGFHVLCRCTEKLRSKSEGGLSGVQFPTPETGPLEQVAALPS
ncbi:MAG: phage head morphogenesis protein [Deltaproteobacteria bacterium]|nr:phage head morphogenesis protein [Deltaproteobacteria bacterium]